MKRRVRLCIAIFTIGLLYAVPAAKSQETPKAHVEIPIVPARPDDVASIEAIVKADYETISGGVGVPRQWARDLSLYDSHARYFSVDKNSKTGGLSVWTPTFQEYADATDAHFVSAGFSEYELAHQTYRIGNVATVLSSYEGKLASTGKVFSRGVNIYQLYYDGKRWWISSISWDSEHEINTIPPELLPKKCP
jgi:hypothetical protein